MSAVDGIFEPVFVMLVTDLFGVTKGLGQGYGVNVVVLQYVRSKGFFHQTPDLPLTTAKHRMKSAVIKGDITTFGPKARKEREHTCRQIRRLVLPIAAQVIQKHDPMLSEIHLVELGGLRVQDARHFFPTQLRRRDEPLLHLNRVEVNDICALGVHRPVDVLQATFS